MNAALGAEKLHSQAQHDTVVRMTTTFCPKLQFLFLDGSRVVCPQAPSALLKDTCFHCLMFWFLVLLHQLLGLLHVVAQLNQQTKTCCNCQASRQAESVHMPLHSMGSRRWQLPQGKRAPSFWEHSLNRHLMDDLCGAQQPPAASSTTPQPLQVLFFLAFCAFYFCAALISCGAQSPLPHHKYSPTEACEVRVTHRWSAAIVVPFLRHFYAVEPSRCVWLIALLHCCILLPAAQSLALYGILTNL